MIRRGGDIKAGHKGNGYEQNTYIETLPQMGCETIKLCYVHLWLCQNEAHSSVRATSIK